MVQTNTKHVSNFKPETAFVPKALVVVGPIKSKSALQIN